jgi:Domain of unknown function (DUF4232)
MTRRPSPRIAAALAVATALALAAAGVAVAVLPATGASADIPNCKVNHLYVAKGRLEGAAGGRFLTVRVTNVGDTLCVVPTRTKTRFRDFDGPLGTAGASPAQGAFLALDPGDTVSTVVHWTDPGPVPANECDAADATLVTLTLPALGHTWRLPLKASVCTTPQWAPEVTALKN